MLSTIPYENNSLWWGCLFDDQWQTICIMYSLSHTHPCVLNGLSLSPGKHVMKFTSAPFGHTHARTHTNAHTNVCLTILVRTLH